MKDLVICGYFVNEDNIDEPVYCDPHTGDLILASDLRGNLLIGNVSVTQPICMEGVDCTELRTVTGAIGVVVTAEYLLAFHENMKVEYRKATSAREVHMESTYDLDADYEGFIE